MCREGGAHHHGRSRVKVRVWPPVMVLGMSPATRELVSLGVLEVGRALVAALTLNKVRRCCRYSYYVEGARRART